MLANGMVAKILIFSLVSVGGIDDKLVIMMPLNVHPLCNDISSFRICDFFQLDSVTTSTK